MPPVDRKNPKRAASSESRYSLMEFMREYPDDEACLVSLWRDRYSPDGEHAFCPSPSCKKERSFKRYATKQQRQSWTCTACGHHLHPTAGTIFHKSSTSLHLWFYAMYLMASTRAGISAKQLERELGVNYKTAYRIAKKIRTELMDDRDTEPLRGEVEVDETYMGGKPHVSPHHSQDWHKNRKVPVLGMVERGGRVKATVMPTLGRVSGPELRPHVLDNIKTASVLYTDESGLYRGMDVPYFHRQINHSERVYVSGEVHTQTIEGFFATLKNGIRGVYHSVSREHLQMYLNEYVFRYNTRGGTDPFRVMVQRAALSD